MIKYGRGRPPCQEDIAMALAERGKADTDRLVANTAAYSLVVAAWNAVPLNQEDDPKCKKGKGRSRSAQSKLPKK